MNTIRITEGSKDYSHIHHKSIKELLAPLEASASYPYMILIEGAPGIGKTIMAKEIAIQWANKNILKNKKILFLLYMRDPKVKYITDVHSLVKFFCQSDSLTNKITEWLAETSGEYLAIVLDGYDEMSTENKSHCIIDSIINRQILPKCAGIITSRPATSLHLHDKVTCRAEILGFSIEDRLGFIQNALKGQNDKIKGLKGFLQSNPSLNALCCIPLNMSILLCLTTEGIDALPKTQTNLYEKFILMTIIHFFKKDKIILPAIISFDDLPHPYDQVVKELSRFAFLALQKDQLVFTLAEVKAEYPNLTPANWYGLGLLKSAQYFKAQDGCDHESVHFLHYSIQEYMAAYYIASLSGKKLLSLLEETFWNVHYFNTWVLYVGITGGKKFEFTHFLSGNYFQIWSWWFETQSISSAILNDKIKCLHLLRCSAEANHEMLSSVETIFQEEIIDLSNQFLSVNGVRILANLLLKLPCKKWKKLDLSGCSITDEGCNLLWELFLPNNMALKIATVDISDNNFHWDSLSKLCIIFRHWKVNKLIMSIEALYDSAAMNIVKCFESKVEKKMLMIGNTYSPFGDNLILTYLPEKNKIIAVFACPCTVRCCVYTDCQLDDDDWTEKLISLIQHINRSKTYRPLVTINYHIPSHVINEKLSTVPFQIAFKGVHMHSRGIFKLKCLPEIIPTNRCFKKVIADFVMATIVHSYSQPNKPYLKSIPVPVARQVKECLQHSSVFTQICASKTILVGKVASDIATVLSCNPYLEVLCFDDNNLQSAGAIKIANALRNFSTLTSIILSNNNIGKEAADEIASILSHNTKLEILKLGRNNFQTTGIIKIAKALQNTYTLTAFEIADNNINKEAADDIATILSHNNKLQELRLGGNNLQTVGAVKIARALQNTNTLTAFGITGNNIGEEAADDIAAALSHNDKLRELYLSDNNLKALGIIMIAKVLENNPCTLTNIDISNNNIGMEESAAVNIAAVLSYCHDLRELHLSGNNLQTMNAIKIARSLQKLSWLNVINFSDNNVSEEAADDIAAALSYKKMLTHLDLSANNFQTTGCIKISRALKNISNLRELNISRNNIGEEAAVDIAAVLSHNNKLQNLDLHHNQLQAAGVIIIAKELQNNTTLEELNISDNNISEEAADDIAAALSHKVMLTKLDLGVNNFQTTGIIKISRTLKNISNLQELNISRNNIGEEAAVDIAVVLSHNNKLQKLYLHHNQLQMAGVITIAKELQNNKALEVFNISENNISKEAIDHVTDILSCIMNLDIIVSDILPTDS